jgi:hypothetical protein
MKVDRQEFDRAKSASLNRPGHLALMRLSS